MHIEQKVNIHNRFDVEVNGKWVGYAENIVLDSMWSRLCNGQAYFANIHFGTGAGTLSAARTTLFTHLGTKAVVNEEQIKAIPVSKWKQKIVLNPEEYVGSILTEVGISWNATNTSLLTHAMLKDAEGNPISITKTAVDVVTIYATVFVTVIENNSKVRLTSVPTSNILLNYLIGGAGLNASTFRLGSGIGPQPYASLGVGFPLLGESSNKSFVADIPNKKASIPVTRFDISTGNGQCMELDFKNLFRMELPATGIFTGQSYSDVSLGVGDGIKTEFMLPSNNVKNETIVGKVNGVITPCTKVNFEEYAPNYAMAVPADLLNLQYDSYSRFIHSKSLNYCVYVVQGGNIQILTGFGTKDMKKIADITKPAVVSVSMLAISHDAETIIFGGSDNKIRILDRIDNAYTQIRPTITALDGIQGVAVSDDGNTIAYGAAYDKYEILDWNGTTWVARPKPSPTPGGHLRDVALSGDGNVFAAVSESSTHGAVYDWNGTIWTKRANPPSIGLQYPQKISISDDGLILGVTVSQSTTYNFAVYDWNGSAWIRRTPSVVRAGFSGKANISPDFTLAIMNTGVIEIYKWNGIDWVSVPNTIIPTAACETIGFRRDNKVLWYPALNTSPIIFMGINKSKIVLDTAAVAGATITADYTTEGVHKTNQYVIDVSFAIQFGEGV